MPRERTQAVCDGLAAALRVATRYDKLAVIYRGAVVLRAITLWLRQ